MNTQRPTGAGVLGLAILVVWGVDILYAIELTQSPSALKSAFGYALGLFVTVTFIGLFLYTNWLEEKVRDLAKRSDIGRIDREII